MGTLIPDLPCIDACILALDAKHGLRCLGLDNLSNDQYYSISSTNLYTHSDYHNVDSTRRSPRSWSCPCERPFCTFCIQTPSLSSSAVGGPAPRRGTLHSRTTACSMVPESKPVHSRCVCCRASKQVIVDIQPKTCYRPHRKRWQSDFGYLIRSDNSRVQCA